MQTPGPADEPLLPAGPEAALPPLAAGPPELAMPLDGALLPDESDRTSLLDVGAHCETHAWKMLRLPSQRSCRMLLTMDDLRTHTERQESAIPTVRTDQRLKVKVS